MQYLDQLVTTLLDHKLRRVTKYVSPTEVIRAHRIVYAGRIDGRDKSIDIRLKIGKPNYHEREFIKDAIKAGEPFPIKKVIFSHFRPRKPRAKKKSRR